MTTLAEKMSWLRAQLANAGIEDPAAETRILIGGLLNLSRTELLTRGNDPLPEEHERRIVDAAKRRLLGEPPYRILGSRGFYGLELKLSVGTLEPRPDTEILVDAVLDWLGPRKEMPLSILDLGTGTGAICLALLSEMPKATGKGVDLSADALATATRNATANGLADRFETVKSSWFENISGVYDVIVSNPPYIQSAIIPTLEREVYEHDPHLALDGGSDGFDAYRAIAVKAGAHLSENGIVAVETGYDQANAVQKIFADNSFAQVFACKDYGGNDRVQAFSLRI